MICRKCWKCCRCYNNEDISMEDLENLKIKMPNLILLDVRSKQEYDEGHLTGSILLPCYEIKKKAESILKDKKRCIVAYCQNGGRSKKAVCMLKQMGYENVYNLKNYYSSQF